MSKYQVHVHFHENKTHGVAEFDTMSEAYLYLIDTIAGMLIALPRMKDAMWLDDEQVNFIAVDGTIFGTATVVMGDSEQISH